MSTEDEFVRWLRRSEKTFVENLRFAIKAWQSLEFSLNRKYEIILQWLSEQDLLEDGDVILEDFVELLTLRAHPGIIGQETKRKFVEWLLKLAQSHSNIPRAEITRKWPEILKLLLEFELLQDLYRLDYELNARTYAVTFQCYEIYLISKRNGVEFLYKHESEFIASVCKTLKDYINLSVDIEKYEKYFTGSTIESFVCVLLELRTNSLDLFEELLELERLLTKELSDISMVRRIIKTPLHVRLLLLESSLVNRKWMQKFVPELIKRGFNDFVNCLHSSQDPGLTLTVAAYNLEIFKRHDINLNIKMDDDKTILQFLSFELYNGIKCYIDTNIREVLLLLRAALRLNPLLLEQNVFELTACIILAPKSNDYEEKHAFEEYLALLMDMFKRLSKAEKFVVNLLKAVKERLAFIEFDTGKAIKVKTPDPILSPAKKRKKLFHIDEEEIHIHLRTIFKDIFKPLGINQKDTVIAKISIGQAFTKLENFWPSQSAGVAFSKLITSLMSKPSLVIWKTLLFALKELLEKYVTNLDLDEKILFLLDFHAALLSQYFAGCKLMEQCEMHLDAILSQRQFSFEILQLFGKFLLEREHQIRLMSSFLELCYNATCFDLTLLYYKADSYAHESLNSSKYVENVHSYLSPQEWILVEQRVVNFGKSNCKFLLQRLQLQRVQAKLLLLSQASIKTGSQYSVFPTILNDPVLLNLTLQSPQAEWMLTQLESSEKQLIAKHLLNQVDLLPVACQDLELLELVTLAIFEDLCSTFTSKRSLLKSLSSYFENIRDCNETGACETLIKNLIEVITVRSNEDYKVKILNSAKIQNALQLLGKLPIGQLRRQRKTIVFALQLSLYRDLRVSEEDDLAAQTLQILKDFLHFGQRLFIFKYFTIESLLKVLPADNCWELYEYFFSTIKEEEKGTEQFLEGLATILCNSQSSGQLNAIERRLLIISIETLNSLSGSSAKRLKKHLDTLLEIFAAYVKNYFTSKHDDRKTKNDKKFVQNTLSSFIVYMNSILAKQSKSANDNPNTEEIDENFRRIVKTYMGHSMDYSNSHSLHLTQIALNYREQLHLDQDEIEFILSNYWRQLNEDIHKGVLEVQKLEQNKSIELAVKMITSNKTNEDFLLTLKTINNELKDENIVSTLSLLRLLAKCPFSIIKGAIFNENYKQIIFNINLRLLLKENRRICNSNHNLLLGLLKCHQAVIENKMVPISMDTIDVIISFLVDLNIKSFSLSDTNIREFYSLHLAMIAVCSSFVKYRQIFLTDRVPQYTHIFKDLIQAILWHKSDRRKDVGLSQVELDGLVESSLKLESLMHLIAQQGIAFKRVAPFLLSFIINLIVSNKRSTTLYNRIKTHIENICYELIAICDHRVGHFMLRSSSEAGRQLYELLIKDYQKYRKFKGKV
uniref:Urb2 domain-containing protein n=1 Tax=Glossina brevipalpis TaxID=37001 RepID=A0A1A9W213_9MUSC